MEYLQLNQEIIDSLGLDGEKIARHHEKIYKVLKADKAISIPIVDVCSVQNNAILSWNTLKSLIKSIHSYKIFEISSRSDRLLWIQKYITTCIPAAGAAARYWYGIAKESVENYAQFPKALLPATAEGDTFLDIKLLEQTFLMPTYANVLIVPYGMGQKFEDIIAHASSCLDVSSRGASVSSRGASVSSRGLTAGPTQWLVLEQTKRLSTIRFKMDASPYCSDENIYSPVPAGHGELIYLFDDVLKHYPHTCGLHFRNIDNIIGIEPERVDELSLLAESFYLIRIALGEVRKCVTNTIQDPKSAEIYLTDPIYLSAVNFLMACYPNLLPVLDPILQGGWENILHQLQKPLSVFGVVKKIAGDEGGGPVFVKMPDGKQVKICLEMSHASHTDREKYFGQNGEALYFNPVLVFFETQTDCHTKTNFNDLFDENFWLLSKRSYLETDVCYHETVLYEFIGNSEKTNVVFIEVPRTLFKPHKYFTDSIGKTRKDYLPSL